MRHVEHFILLIWAVTTGLVAFGLVVTVDTGLMQSFILEDRSYICTVIIAMYAAGLAHSFQRTLYLSRQLNAVAATERMLESPCGARLRLAGGRVTGADGTPLPEGFVADYIADYVGAQPSTAAAVEAESGGDLLEAYASRLRGRHEFGWFWIDLMLKIGFLGTLVGFIMMLASVSQNTVIDASTMQNVLKQMSFGMATALNTTLASLVAGTLLSFPYYLLGRGLDELVESAIRITQVDVLPRLGAGEA